MCLVKTMVSRCLLVCGLLPGLLFWAGAAGANERFPEKPIRLVVPWVPGGFTDALARLVAERMAKAGGQAVVVENRPGANGMIGTSMVAKSAPDGYTLLMATADTHAINPFIYTKVSYDAVRDFAAVGLIASVPLVLVTNMQFTEKTLPALIDAARKSPGKFKYASWGAGSTGHLAMELFNSPAGVSMTHVPYKGLGAAITDVISGEVDMTLMSLLTGESYFKSNRLRGLAITSPKRSPMAPELPTIAELGYPGYDVSLWYGLVAPSHTPPAVIARLNEILREATNEPDFKAKMASSSAEILGGPPSDFDAFLVKERAKWESAAKAANVKLDQ